MAGDEEAAAARRACPCGRLPASGRVSAAVPRLGSGGSPWGREGAGGAGTRADDRRALEAVGDLSTPPRGCGEGVPLHLLPPRPFPSPRPSRRRVAPTSARRGPRPRRRRAAVPASAGGGSHSPVPRPPPRPDERLRKKLVDASGEVARRVPPARRVGAGRGRPRTDGGSRGGGEGPAPPRGAGRGPGADAPGSRVCRVEDNAWLTRQGPRQVLSSRVLELVSTWAGLTKKVKAPAPGRRRARGRGWKGAPAPPPVRWPPGLLLESEAAVASRETRRGRPSYTSAQGGGGWRRKRRRRLWHSAKAEEQGLPAPRRHVRPCVAHLPTPVRKKEARRAGVGWFRDYQDEWMHGVLIAQSPMERMRSVHSERPSPLTCRRPARRAAAPACRRSPPGGTPGGPPGRWRRRACPR